MSDTTMKRWGVSMTYAAKQHVVLEFPEDVSEKEVRAYIRDTTLDELEPTIVSLKMQIDEVHELCWMEHGETEGEGCVCERPKGHSDPCSCDALNADGSVNK